MTESAELELVEIVRILWDRRSLVLTIMLVCGASAGLSSMISDPVYEASVTLLASGSKLGEQAAAPPSVPTLRTLLTSTNNVAVLLDEFDLPEAGLAVDPDGFVRAHTNVEQLRDTTMIRATVRLPDPELAANVANRMADLAVELNQRINQGDTVATRDFLGTQLDAARTRLDEFESAYASARAAAQIPFKEARHVVLIERVRGLEALEFDLSRGLRFLTESPAPERLAQAQNDLLEYRRAAQVEQVRSQLSVGAVQRDRLEGQRGTALVGLAAAESRLQRLEEQLAALQPIIGLNRSIAEQPLLLEAARERGEGRSLVGLTLVDETLNPTHGAVAAEAVMTRAEVAGLNTSLATVDEAIRANEAWVRETETRLADAEVALGERQRRYEMAEAEFKTQFIVSSASLQSQLDVVRSEMTETRSELTRLQEELFRVGTELDRLEAETELARLRYGELFNEYERASLQVASRSAQLQVIDRATVPTRPSGPRVRRNTLLGLLLGSILGAFGALGSAYIARTW